MADIVIDSDIPLPEEKKIIKPLVRRQRRYTEELFRCQFTDQISRHELICNHLLWKNKPDELRDHLEIHLGPVVRTLTDSHIAQHYLEAKRIFLQPIPEDQLAPGELEEYESQYDNPDSDPTSDPADSDPGADQSEGDCSLSEGSSSIY